MAKYRIRRWFQFGILDLLLLTTAVAVIVFLFRPVTVRVSKALPWIFGTWKDDRSILTLFPDGYYEAGSRGVHDEGVGWTITRATTDRDTFILNYGQRRFIVRNEWGSGMMELLDDSGMVKVRLYQDMRLEGPLINGTPHGAWTGSLLQEVPSGPHGPYSLEYRNGKLIDARWLGDVGRDFGSLNATRRAHGLPELTEWDFDNQGAPQERHR